MTEKTECKNFKNCSASICPLDLRITNVWFPDEGICNQFNHAWIKVQRKIAKKSKNRAKYFTLKMLKKDCVIGADISGLDPEKERVEELKKWMRKHPVKQKWAEEEKAELKMRQV